MKKVIVGLTLALFFLNFVSAVSVSNVRADFIVSGISLDSDSREQNYIPLCKGFQDYVPEILIVILVLIVFFVVYWSRRKDKPSLKVKKASVKRKRRK